MRVLITGGSGLIGQALTESLVQDNNGQFPGPDSIRYDPD